MLQFCEKTRLNGVPLMVVAKNLGHTDTRMVEKHYGHLAPGYVADAIRAGAPMFGIKPEKTKFFLQPVAFSAKLVELVEHLVQQRFGPRR
jgi:hypothetical protein